MDGVSVGVIAAVGVIAVVQLDAVPHRGVPIVALAAGVAPAVLIAVHGLQRGRAAAPAAPTAEVARQEAPAHVPAPSRASDRRRRAAQKQRPLPQQIEAQPQREARHAANSDK